MLGVAASSLPTAGAGAGSGAVGQEGPMLAPSIVAPNYETAVAELESNGIASRGPCGYCGMPVSQTVTFPPGPPQRNSRGH